MIAACSRGIVSTRMLSNHARNLDAPTLRLVGERVFNTEYDVNEYMRGKKKTIITSNHIPRSSKFQTAF